MCLLGHASATSKGGNPGCLPPYRVGTATFSQNSSSQVSRRAEASMGTRGMRKAVIVGKTFPGSTAIRKLHARHIAAQSAPPPATKPQYKCVVLELYDMFSSRSLSVSASRVSQGPPGFHGLLRLLDDAETIRCRDNMTLGWKAEASTEGQTGDWVAASHVWIPVFWLSFAAQPMRDSATRYATWTRGGDKGPCKRAGCGMPGYPRWLVTGSQVAGC